jgi:hypothetical protein
LYLLLDKVTVALSGAKYSTFVNTLIVQLKVQSFIPDPSLFNFLSDYLTKAKRIYFELSKSLLLQQSEQLLEFGYVLLLTLFIGQEVWVLVMIMSLFQLLLSF